MFLNKKAAQKLMRRGQLYANWAPMLFGGALFFFIIVDWWFYPQHLYKYQVVFALVFLFISFNIVRRICLQSSLDNGVGVSLLSSAVLSVVGLICAFLNHFMNLSPVVSQLTHIVSYGPLVFLAFGIFPARSLMIPVIFLYACAAIFFANSSFLILLSLALFKNMWEVPSKRFKFYALAVMLCLVFAYFFKHDIRQIKHYMGVGKINATKSIFCEDRVLGAEVPLENCVSRYYAVNELSCGIGVAVRTLFPRDRICFTADGLRNVIPCPSEQLKKDGRLSQTTSCKEYLISKINVGLGRFAVEETFREQVRQCATNFNKAETIVPNYNACVNRLLKSENPMSSTFTPGYRLSLEVADYKTMTFFVIFVVLGASAMFSTNLMLRMLGSAIGFHVLNFNNSIHGLFKGSLNFILIWILLLACVMLLQKIDFRYVAIQKGKK
jgi:hypothetical protein